MGNRKNKSIKTLKSAAAACEKNAEFGLLNGFKRICCAYISTGDERQRERAIKKILRQEQGLTNTLRQNDELLTALAERALMELACGCTVTERKTRTTPNGKIVEETVRQLPPNEAALSFILTNRDAERYSKNPQAKSGDGNGCVADIVEALKNVK